MKKRGLMKRNELISVLKSQQWEKCKGELFSLVALDGSNISHFEPCYYEELQQKIKTFIEEINDSGWIE